MIRNIIKIDREKCNGCGACAAACHEGAIEMINGKAVLTREDYCDGLGDCLPACPTGAIAFEKREAPAYDHDAVERAKQAAAPLPCGCPGTHARAIRRDVTAPTARYEEIPSELNQWPCQLKLVPIHAPYLNNAHLLVAADCTAFAYGDLHRRFMRDRITLIGCPKLDEGDYAEKLTEIVTFNTVKSVTVLRMEVPCCGGIENAVKRAINASGKAIPCHVVTITTDGQILP